MRADDRAEINDAPALRAEPLYRLLHRENRPEHVLGFTMIGSEAGELMAAVQASLPYWRLRDAVLAHPTMAEGLGPLFSNVPPRSVQ